MEETIMLRLTASDFQAAGFLDCEYCPIANAVRRQTGECDVSEGVIGTFIGGAFYRHDEYSLYHYNGDRKMAIKANFTPDIVIREIKLTKVN